jgi:hypothetical protein
LRTEGTAAPELPKLGDASTAIVGRIVLLLLSQ